MVIVYRSNTGFTREYAEMLGRAEKMKACPLSEAQGKVGPGESVFYMGPLMAGHISGIDQAVKKFAVKGVCGVGRSPASPPVLVARLKRRMVGMATKSMRASLQDKGGRRTPEEDRQLDFLIHGGSFVAFENLETIRAWMKRA